MANAIKKAIRKVRRKPTTPVKVENPIIKIIALYKASQYKQAFWERDKKIVRDDNFKKALIARREQIKEINAEKERQVEIAEQRLQNLKKARRKLKRLRENEADI
jgi:hypothetical protein